MDVYGSCFSDVGWDSGLEIIDFNICEEFGNELDWLGLG